MIGTGRIWAIVLLAFLLAQTLSSATSPSGAASNSADQGHHDDHDHHNHDHAHHAHDHDHGHGHACGHDHHGAHSHTHQDRDHHHHHQFSPADSAHTRAHKLPEELAEEEELRIFGFKSDVHVDEKHHNKHALPSIGLWMRALGCSLLVSMASLICLILLPLIVAQGKPSRVVVDFLAAFGAGAMLGDAFLHQLPHALGDSSGHSHSHGAGHDHNHGHSHQHHDGLEHSHTGGHGHAHSIQDLSVGLAVLAGIILFFIVEKIVRQVEKASSKGTLPWAHHHHHHHHLQHEHDGDEQHREEDDEKAKGEKQTILSKDDIRTEDTSETSTHGSLEHKQHNTDKPYRRKKTAGIQEESETTPLLPEEDSEKKSNAEVIEQIAAPNLVLGYLNLFSDGVHNFTDGVALGAAFLNHGTLGGWSRTLFLLAHELPQEVGDFGILVQSGFSVLKALAFNFLSALAALAGTAVALLLGGNPGHSSLIEGFTAGGFIYIAVAGVLPEMHQHGSSTKTTCLQLVALSLGMSVALAISLVE